MDSTDEQSKAMMERLHALEMKAAIAEERAARRETELALRAEIEKRDLQAKAAMDYVQAQLEDV